jgi:hypothetical protein
MERNPKHIVHTERVEPKRRLIRSDGALYVVLLLGVFAAIFLSRVLANALGINTLLVQIVLYALLLGTGYAIYRMRLVDYLYELYDTELRVVQAVGVKRKPLISVPLDAVEKVGPFEKSDAKPEVRAFRGAKENTTAVWFIREGQRFVLCLNASDALKEKLTEAVHAKE